MHLKPNEFDMHTQSTFPAKACQTLLVCIEQTHLLICISLEKVCRICEIAARTDMVLVCMQEQFNRQLVLAQPEVLKRSLDAPTSKTLSASLSAVLSASSASPKQQQNDAELPHDIV